MWLAKKWLILITFSFQILLLISCSNLSRDKLFKRIRVKPISITEDVINTTFEAKTLVQCGSFCLSDVKCNAFVWNVSNFTCNSASGQHLVGDNTSYGAAAYIDTSIKSVDGVWSEWSSLSSCNQSCDTGHQSRYRSCLNASFAGFQICQKNFTDVETLTCNTQACPLVLVANGELNQALASIEIVSISSTAKSCQSLTNFPYATEAGGGGLGFDDKPFVCGGFSQNQSACYTYANGSWQASHYLNKGRYDFAMIQSPFQDGSSKLLITGGYGSGIIFDTFEVLTVNGWQASVPMPAQMYQHCMVAVNSTAVMVIGGYQCINGGPCVPSKSSFIFSSATQFWYNGPSMKSARYWHACETIRTSSQSQQKSIITVGGNSNPGENPVEVLDIGIGSNLWPYGWLYGRAPPFAITGAALVQDPNGGVVLIGGYSTTHLNTLYRLPHATLNAAWELMPTTLKTARYRHTAFLVPNELGICT